jgi:hypothetical protein
MVHHNFGFHNWDHFVQQNTANGIELENIVTPILPLTGFCQRNVAASSRQSIGLGRKHKSDVSLHPKVAARYNSVDISTFESFGSRSCENDDEFGNKMQPGRRLGLHRILR